MKRKITDKVEIFEKALDEKDRKHYLFRLYITGTNPRSMQAVKNLKKICIDYLDGRYELEVIDVHQQPGAAQADEIIAIPTLVKELPPPLKKFIGDLSNINQILAGLAIEKKK